VLLAVVPIDVVTHSLSDRYDQPLELLKNLFLFPQNDQIIDVCWSLCNELVFYALFGLTIFNRRLGLIVISLWIPAMIARLLVAPHVDITWFNLLTYPMNFEFIASVGAGWLMQRRQIRRPGIVLAAGLAVFAVFAIAEYHRLLCSNEPHLWFPGVYWYVLLLRCLGYGTAGVLIIAGLSALELQGRIRVPRPFLLLGGASYLLYLVHVPALLVLGASERQMHLLRFVPPWLLATFFVALVIAGTIAVHLTVEKPLLRVVRPRKAGAGSTQQASAIV
jgi:exopolysaccharide production protein ExoZ